MAEKDAREKKRSQNTQNTPGNKNIGGYKLRMCV